MITISERFPQLFVFRAISIASHVHLLSRRTLIMGRLIEIQSRFRSHELSHFFLLWLIDLSCLLCDRRSRINLIRPLLEESRRIYSSLMPTALGTWLGLSRISLFPSHLNLSSHALIYNLLFLMNLKSDNLCCFIFVLANDRGETFCARCAVSGSMLSLLPR